MEFNFFFPLTLRDAHVQKGPLAENVYILSEAVTLSGPPSRKYGLGNTAERESGFGERCGNKNTFLSFFRICIYSGAKKKGEE